MILFFFSSDWRILVGMKNETSGNLKVFKSALSLAVIAAVEVAFAATIFAENQVQMCNTAIEQAVAAATKIQAIHRGKKSRAKIVLRAAVRVQKTLYQCDNLCGYKASYDDVWKHEATCQHDPEKAAQKAAKQAQEDAEERAKQEAAEERKKQQAVEEARVAAEDAAKQQDADEEEANAAKAQETQAAEESMMAEAEKVRVVVSSESLQQEAQQYATSNAVSAMSAAAAAYNIAFAASYAAMSRASDAVAAALRCDAYQVKTKFANADAAAVAFSAAYHATEVSHTIQHRKS